MAREIKHSRFDPTPRTRGRRWMQAKSLWLMQHPLCQHCKQAGKVTMATEVDHVMPLCKGGTDDPQNLSSLCAECHRTKTNQDLGYRPARRVGTDGVPEGWT